MSKHSMRRGALGQAQRVLQRLLMACEDGFSTRKRCVEAVLGVGLHQVQQRLLLAALRRVDLHLAAALLREQLFERLAVLEIHRHVDRGGDVLLVEVELLEQRGEELRLVELRLVFPEELAAVHDLAVAQVEQVDRHQRRLGVDSRRCRCRRPRRRPSSAAPRSPRRWRSGRAAPAASSKRISSAACSMRAAQFARQVAVPAFQEQPHVAHRARRRPRPWSAPRRTAPGSGGCGTAGTAWDAGASRSTLQEGTRKCRWMKCTSRCARLAGK